MKRTKTINESPSSSPSGPSSRLHPPRWMRPAGILAGMVVAVGLAAFGIWLVSTRGQVPAGVPATGQEAPAAGTPVPGLSRPVVTADGLADRSGVQIVHVASTGDGGLIDLRFLVTDSNKAEALHDESSPPVLVDEATGVVVNSLLMGHSHSGTYRVGQTYYLIFENPGNLVQRGGKVSVLLGNAEVDHVTVQ